MIPDDPLGRSRAVSHLLKYFGSQAEMAQAIGMSSPCVNNWLAAAFPLPPRLKLLGVCLRRGCPVDPEVVLGRDMVALICQIAEANKRAPRPRGSARRAA